jgi:hypothetical protein
MPCAPRSILLCPLTSVVVMCGVVALSVGTGCSREQPRTTPEGGLQAMAAAISSQDPTLIWETLSESNRAEFARAFDRLRDMERIIEMLQPEEREAYREAAGLTFAATLESPWDLYLHIMRNIALCTTERCLQGMVPAQIDMEQGQAVVRTRADQTWTLVVSDDGLWRVQAPVDDFIRRSLARIHRTHDALTEIAQAYGAGIDELDELRRWGLLAPLPDEETEPPSL